MTWRISPGPDSSPRAASWTAPLPSAVASAGPQCTGKPVASAVNWDSRVWLAPPPTMEIDGGAVAERKRVDHAAGHGADGLRDHLTVAGAIAADPFGHVTRRQEVPGI